MIHRFKGSVSRVLKKFTQRDIVIKSNDYRGASYHLFHRWSKWEQYNDQYLPYLRMEKLGMEQMRQLMAMRIYFTQRRQKRYCLICKKEQDMEISGSW